MRHLFITVAGLAGIVLGMASVAQTYNIGRIATEEELQDWDLPVGPAGEELPPGQGTAREGAAIYVQECVMCHGVNGDNGRYSELKGHLRTYPTTTWDFINRSMPRSLDNVGFQSKKLEPDAVYALTAYILFINGVIGEDDVMDRDTLPGVIVPLD